MTVKTEAQLEAVFSQRVKLLGGYTIKLAPTERGVPDRLVIFPPGRLYLVELKTEKGYLSPIQEHWHARMAARGARVHTLYGERAILDWITFVADQPSNRGVRRPDYHHRTEVTS